MASDCAIRSQIVIPLTLVWVKDHSAERRLGVRCRDIFMPDCYPEKRVKVLGRNRKKPARTMRDPVLKGAADRNLVV
jgi:hypothetical protein